METQTIPQTLYELKEAARQQQAARTAELARMEQETAQARQRCERAVLAAITELFPALALAAQITLEHEPYLYNGEQRLRAKFELADHAPLYARFTIANDEKRADPIGFDEKHYYGDGDCYWNPDPTRMWRVDYFSHVKWDDLGDAFGAFAQFTPQYFISLGAALLAAETQYVDPLLIQKEIDDLTARHAAAEETKTAATTTEERFMSALKDLILEFASQMHE